jgi:hypothetical protein
MSVEDYAIDELFDVGSKSNSVSTLGACYSAHADFSNWTKVQPFAAAPAHRFSQVRHRRYKTRAGRHSPDTQCM